MNDGPACEDFACDNGELPRMPNISHTSVAAPFSVVWWEDGKCCHHYQPTHDDAQLSEVQPQPAAPVTYKDKQITALKIELAEADAVIHFLLDSEQHQPDPHYQRLLSSWTVKSGTRWDGYPKGA